MNSGLKNILVNGIKSFKCRKGNGKKVHIDCTDKNVGKEVYAAIVNYKHELMMSGFKKVNKGSNYKDFTVVFNSKEEADYFLTQLENYTSLLTVFTEEDPETEKSSASMLIIIGVILLIAIGYFVWKKKR